MVEQQSQEHGSVDQKQSLPDIEEEKVNSVSEHDSVTGSDESESQAESESQDEIKPLNSPMKKHGERNSGQIADLQTFDEKRHVDIILTVAPKNRSVTSSAQQILQAAQNLEVQ